MMRIYFFVFCVLAMAVSCRDKKSSGDEVLESFNKVDSSLAASAGRAHTAARDLLDSITAKSNEGESTWKNKANQAMNYSFALSDFIEKIKHQLRSYPDDALEPANELLLKNMKGQELLNRIEQYNRDIMALDPGYADLYKNEPAIDVSISRIRNSGPEYYFKSVPVAAVFALLTKWQNDISNEELRFVHYCLQQVNAPG